MIKVLKLQKAVYVIGLGILAVILSQLMNVYEMSGANIALGFSGLLFIASALMFIYPFLFAKKVDNSGKKVELQPLEDDASNKPD